MGLAWGLLVALGLPRPHFLDFREGIFEVDFFLTFVLKHEAKPILVTLAPFGGHFRERFAEKITFSLGFKPGSL